MFTFDIPLVTFVFWYYVMKLRVLFAKLEKLFSGHAFETDTVLALPHELYNSYDTTAIFRVPN